MIHLTEDMILAVRDREPVADEVLAHIDECGACARALEDARSRAEAVEQALAALTVPRRMEGRAEIPEGRGRSDVAAGAGTQVVSIERGRSDGTAGTGVRVVPIDPGLRDAGPRTRARRSVWSVRWLGRAAVLVLIAAGALSALPGPFNGWIPRVFSGGSPLATPIAPAPEPAGQVGGRMEVVSGPVLVHLENVVPGTVIDVRRVAGRAVGVLAATGSEFSYGSGEVRAAVVAGPVTVELPDGVVPATLIVNGATYLVVDAVGMEVPGPATAAVGESLVTFQVPN
ncbi:MAG: hypothetical protein OXR82_11350 [Gammaproteobacteria bacterium]|nr:hypothetical protein [Gammaproteobacteria bacterium]MDE0258961.1 hypothetical protein [Gammaproteobacteria bacterium]